MALGKLSRRLLIKYYLVEEMEDEVLFQMHGGKG